MADCHPTTYPVAPSATLETHKRRAANFPYSQVVGLGIYFAIGIHPNLAFRVGEVSHFASNLGKVHVKAIKRILCFLHATINIGFTFDMSNN
jgi:hypothetical protein